MQEGSRRARVLVVDDDAPNARTFRRVFRERYEVLTALSGAEALSLLESAPVDVALVDYSMPGMDGLALLRRIERRSPGVARILLTGYEGRPEILEARRTGLATVLSKPWDPDHIERAIEEALAAGRGGG